MERVIDEIGKRRNGDHGRRRKDIGDLGVEEEAGDGIYRGEKEREIGRKSGGMDEEDVWREERKAEGKVRRR